ncbi:MAG: zinc ribbon domain-containing protein [Hyphomicrobium sp.]|uniref:zinc ribbon domain-containing protein n=1 Tax=Hyphomicrobium sp. TaxID=82 RepID=UPI0013252026|nr:zinc ribbon domain-containing protein [Hyphomicrobium sp.]KAB2941750.1 MAG: zinc ribbon domain-containing protein [Hyphomicrobium sp.]MBZ0210280.1 zinc ribbon domain-containing protein [Hyphomicrobium sp.]
MPTRAEATLSSEEFAVLLNHFNVDLPRGSPLGRPCLPADSKGAAAALQRKGLLNGEWQLAVRDLADARRQIVVQRTALDASGTLCFHPLPSTQADLLGILVTRVPAGDYRLQIHLTLPNLLTEVFDPLDPIGTAPPMVFDRAFTPAGLTVLAAAVDYTRMLYAATLIERRGIAGVVLTRGNLEQQVLLGIKSSDRRSLVTLLHGFLPDVMPVAPSEFKAGLEEMASAGLVVADDADDETFLASGVLLDAAINLLSPVPALMVGDSSAPSFEDGNWSIVMRGNSLWELQPAGDAAERKVRFRSIDGLTALSDELSLIRKLAGWTAATKPANASDVIETTEPSPTTMDAAWKAKLAGAIETEEPPRTKFCIACGSELRPLARFCTKCGAQVA